MLTITKTHTSVETDGNETNTFTTYETTGSVKLAMDSIWDYEGADTVNVSSIQIIDSVDNEDGTSWKQVNVEHDAKWEIYTDSGFENAISEAINLDVSFTEQGMQDDGYASMEV
jgi:hypothetical protein|tara:strand:+ start:740 stop:1081 length:342 start_codon:yes stop_codon:yes gene_type:complete